MGRTASVKKSIMKKQSECQYAQLVFDQPSSSSNSRTFATDDSVLYVNPSPQHRRHRGETNYATIDHSRRHGGHGKPSSSKSGRSKGGLMHSASCPFKVKLSLVIMISILFRMSRMWSSLVKVTKNFTYHFPFSRVSIRTCLKFLR